MNVLWYEQTYAFASVHRLVGGAVVALVWCGIIYAVLRFAHKPSSADTAFRHTVRVMIPALAFVWSIQYLQLLFALFAQTHPLPETVFHGTPIRISSGIVQLQIPGRFWIFAGLHAASWFYVYLLASRRSLELLYFGSNWVRKRIPGRKDGLDIDEILALSDEPGFRGMAAGPLVFHAVTVLLMILLWLWALSPPLSLAEFYN